MSRYNPRVVNFVMGTRQAESRSRGSRPPSGCSATNERPFSSLSSGCCGIEDNLEELKDKLQISHIDDVISHLRSLLEDECRALEKDIKILQQHLEESQTLQTEPSLTELREERRLLERDLQRDQLPTSKMASSRKQETSGLLDLGRRGEEADLQVLQKMSSSPNFLQCGPSVTPSPPDPKLKNPGGRIVRKGFTGPGAPPCTSASTVKGPEEPGLSAALGSVPLRLERVSRGHSPLCDWGKGPCVTSHRTAPPRALVTPMTTLLVPLPPKVQRPPNSSSPAPTFRRVRTQVMNLPP